MNSGRIHNNNFCDKSLLAVLGKKKEIYKSQAKGSGYLLEPVPTGAIPGLTAHRLLRQGFWGIREG